MDIAPRKPRLPRVICIGSIIWAVAATTAAFVFPERAAAIIGFMLGFFGIPLTMLTPLPMIFVPRSWAPGHFVSLALVAAGFLIQWQLIAWLVHWLRRRKEPTVEHTRI